MVRKKHDLIRTGLSSELFLLILLRPDSGYGLAKRLQKRKTPSTSKIYPALDDLERNRYIRKNGKYHVNPKKLVLEFEKLLEDKNIQFDDAEKELLTRLLSSNALLGILSGKIIKDLRKQSNYNHKLDALSIFANHIGEFSAVILHQRENDSEIKKASKIMEKLRPQDILDYFEGITVNIDKKIDSIIEEAAKDYEKYRKHISDFDEIVENTKYSMKNFIPITVFYIIKKPTLKKLCRLWDQYDGFKFGVKIGMKQTKKKTFKKKTVI